MQICTILTQHIDAYVLNLATEHGCRRNNLHSAASKVRSCPRFTKGGVDLNRNHPIDWQPSPTSGPAPWSEPESRTVRDVVLKYKIAAAISFHSLGKKGKVPPLLIHPYGARDLSSMPKTKLDQYHSLCRSLNEDHFYRCGTVRTLLNFSAGGSTIDWMDSVGTISFVVEVEPPCSGRWCDDIDAVYRSGFLERYGHTAKLVGEFLTRAQVVIPPGNPRREWAPDIQLWLTFLVMASMIAQRLVGKSSPKPRQDSRRQLLERQ